MKLRRLLVIEIGATIAVLLAVLIAVEISPYLIATNPSNSIGMFNEKEFASNTISIARGQSARFQFNYSSFDPVIMVMDLSFMSFEVPGDLSIICNGKNVTTLNVTPEEPDVRLNLFSVSGLDWLEVTTQVSQLMFGNEITLVSSQRTGYEGTFSYKVNIRGSR